MISFEDARRIAGSDRTDPVPDDWKSAAQYAEAWGCSEDHASKLLRALVAQGRVERRAFRIKRGNRPYPVSHFREKKPAG